MLATWSGDIPNGTVWTSAEIQQLTGNVRVPAGSTLTIQPGTIIKANSFPVIRLTVEGTLIAQGTAGQPILFTSFRDDSGFDNTPGNADDLDSNGDGPSNGAPGDWGGINFAATSTGSTLDRVEVRYAVSGQEPFGTPAVFINGGQVTIANSTIRKSLGNAMRVAAGSPVLSNVTFVDNNQGAAITMALAANPAVTGASFTNNAINGVLVDSGALPGDTTWADPSAPYMLTGDITVPAGMTLTIGAGQIIKSATEAGSIFTSNLLVDGRLLAQGTAQQPVIFTSRRDDSAGGDTNNNGLSAGLPGDWSFIRFSATSTGSVMDHAQVRYAGNGFFAGTSILVNGGGLTLSNSVVSDSATAGVRVSAGTPAIQNVSFQGNLGAAISIGLDTNPAITGGAYTGNGVNGVLVDAGALTADASWNDPDVVYQLNGDVTVPAGKTLTIVPGQIVKSFTLSGFVVTSGFIVEGRLLADGTKDRPIILTSRRDDSAGGDTNNDNASTGAKGDWDGLRFTATSAGSVLDNVEVRFTGHILPAAIETATGGLMISETVLSDGNGLGVRVTAGRPKLTNVAIENHTGSAASITPVADMETSGVTASGNGTNAILVDGGTLAADHSWISTDLPYQLHPFGDVTVPAGITLSLAIGAVLEMPINRSLLGAGIVNNAGTIRRSTTGTATIAPAVVNTGSIKVQAGSLILTGGVTNNANGTIGGQLGTTLGIGEDLAGNTTNAAAFAPLASVTFRGPGSAADPQLFEALSADKGSTAAGFDDNFAFHFLALASNTVVKLVDNANNAPGAGAEAVYVNNLVVPGGTTLDLNGLKLYARATGVSGTVSGGTITILPDGGPLTIDTLTPGRIAVAAEVDDWTFFGRAGQAVTITLGTGAASPTPPLTPSLNRGHIELFDPAGASLGTATNATSGQEVSLAGVVLPADGVYHVKVKAAPALPNSTGSYVLTAWNATVNVAPLVLNQIIHGEIDTPFRTDRYTFTGQAGQVFNFNVVKTENPNVRFDLTGPNAFTAFSNQANSVDSVTLPTTGDYALTVHTAQRQTGAYAFRFDSITVTTLTLGTPFNGPVGGGRQSQLFKVNVPASAQLRVTLTDTVATDRNELYVKFGAAPTRGDHQYKFSTPASANQRVDVPSAAPGDWFILVYTEAVPIPGGNLTLLAETGSVFLTSITPDHAGNGAEAVLTLTGVGFDNTTTVSLVSASNAVFPATTVEHDSPTRLTVKFAAGAVPAGSYSVRVNKSDGGSATLPNAFTFSQGGQAKFETQIILPNALGYHIPGVIYVEYANTGELALPAPLLHLNPTQTYADGSTRSGAFLTLDQSRVTQGFWTSAEPEGFTHSIQFLASGKTPGVLQPGEKVRLPVYWAGWQLPFDLTYPPFVFNLSMVAADNTAPVPWSEMKADLQPAGISGGAWDAIFANLTAQLGDTWGDVVTHLDQDAAYLGKLGEKVGDLGELWSFEIQRANGIGPVETLASAVDMDLPSIGLPLGIGRTFGSTIVDRQATGPFGNGWVLGIWSQTLSVRSDNSVEVSSPNSPPRVFQPDSRSNRYFSPPGDYSTLANVGSGAFTLTDSSGLVTQFTNGNVGFVQDANGNKITAGYTNNRLTSLTASSGQSITLAYNAAGRITGLTNSLGQTATYTYDANNQFLLSVTDADGYVTSYTYDTSTDPEKRNALLTTTFPSNTQEVFTYDAKGRLSQISQQAGAQPLTLAYGANATVTAKNAGGDTSTLFYDHQGRLAKVVDPLNRSVINDFDKLGNLVQRTDAAGQISTFSYNKQGQLLQTRNELGQLSKFAYGALARLTSATDAKGNTTRYQYDAKGNRVSTTYSDSTIESLAYDPVGQLIQSTDGNKNVIQYAFNAAGQLTKKTFADASETIFTYNALANLASVQDPLGTTTLEYDAANRLKKITYPDNKFLSYTYDAGGRRTQMVDQAGFTVNYTYNALGQLSGLKDGSNAAIVTYTYDNVGRLKEELKGNNTKTTYTHDAAGQLLSIVNAAPGGGVNSSFVYTYDKLSRAITETTLQGKWDYTYDAIGQLTRAVFTSSNPGQVPNQDLQYFYDPAGNRTQTIINGVTTNYVTNSRNEYTQVGATTNAYDANGNLIARTDSGGLTSFTYDVNNRLVGIQPPTGANSAYTYDAFGNLYASSEGGQTTRVLTELLNGNLIGQFASGGAPIAHYAYGVGLVSQTTGGGNTSFYDFDLRGSTAGLANAGGAYANTYSYLPFGSGLTTATTTANPFEFVGRYGVITAGANLDLMGARFYDSGTGQFVADDPIGLAGGDVNIRRYVGNNPITSVDPSGLNVLKVLLEALAETLTGLGVDILGDVYRKKSKEDIAEDILLSPVEVAPLPGLGGAIDIANDNPLDTVRGVNAIVNGDPEEEAALDYLRGELGGKKKPPPAPPPTPTPCEETETESPEFIQGGSLSALDCGCGDGEDPFQIAAIVVCQNLSAGQSSNAASMDPNEKIGPTGFGPSGFIRGAGVFAYRVNFENDKDAAAPAQQVRITDQLSTNLNWDTFQFTEFGFGDEIVAVPEGSQSFQTAVPLTFNGQAFDVLITADFFSQTGLVNVLFQSIDPTTELPPDVLTGFLPPEDGTGRGQGHFSYLVEPKANLTTGTQLKNIALITFDSNPPIATNQIDPHDPSAGTSPAKEAINTIDVGGPTSSVTGLPPVQNAIFTLNWAGTDDAGGSGVGTYDVFVSDDNGPTTLFRDDTSLTSATFNGVAGHTYRFFAVATDNVGHEEVQPPSFEAQTTITTHPWFNAPRPLDVDNNGQVVPFDALLIINYLNAGSPAAVPPTAATGGGPGFLDTTGNDEVAPFDALIIVNALNAGVAGEGEAAADVVQVGTNANERAEAVRVPHPIATPNNDMDELLAILASDAAEAATKKRRAR